MVNPSLHLSCERISELVSRLNLMPQLLLRHEQEKIIDLVNIDLSTLSEKRDQILAGMELSDFLTQNNWQQQDFNYHLAREESLQKFAKQRFGSGLEELFLASKEQRDSVVYSLIRVRDPGLARELWIRLEEAEMTFNEAASAYGEGPEAIHNGVMGPVPIGSLQPALIGEMLRNLRPGQLMPPHILGEWHLLLRLEQLTPARFDQQMINQLLDEQLNNFLQLRVQSIINGLEPEPLVYDA